MNKYVIIFSILNVISFSFGRVVYNENDVNVNINENDINKNTNPDIKYYENRNYSSYEYSIEGAACDNYDENNNCPYRFATLGPLTYNGQSECYIHSPRAGPNDRLEYVSGVPRSMFADINAELKCNINGKEYRTMQRVNIQVSSEYKYRDKYVFRSLPAFTTLNFGKNRIVDGTTIIDINVGNCESVWTHKARQIDENNCKIDWVGYSSEKCGTIDGISYICINGCCGADGRCGNSNEQCGNGCQAFYGNCGIVDEETTTIVDNIDSSKNNENNENENSSNVVTTTTDGRCGSYNGKNCHTGYCCSEYGYCGKTDEHCGHGCQSEFGKCY